MWAVALLFLLRQREQAQTNLRKSEADIRDLGGRPRRLRPGLDGDGGQFDAEVGSGWNSYGGTAKIAKAF